MTGFGIACTACRIRGRVYRFDGMKPHATIRRGYKAYTRETRLDVEEGFVTTDGDFVDRYEAYDIALSSGQINPDCKSPINRSYGITHNHLVPMCDRLSGKPKKPRSNRGTG